MALPNKSAFLKTLMKLRKMLPSTRLDPDAECPICYERFISPVELSCGHIFCRRCAKKAFRISAGCPMCRARMYEGVEILRRRSEGDLRLNYDMWVDIRLFWSLVDEAED